MLTSIKAILVTKGRLRIKIGAQILRTGSRTKPKYYFLFWQRVLSSEYINIFILDLFRERKDCWRVNIPPSYLQSYSYNILKAITTRIYELREKIRKSEVWLKNRNKAWDEKTLLAVYKVFLSAGGPQISRYKVSSSLNLVTMNVTGEIPLWKGEISNLNTNTVLWEVCSLPTE